MKPFSPDYTGSKEFPLREDFGPKPRPLNYWATITYRTGGDNHNVTKNLLGQPPMLAGAPTACKSLNKHYFRELRQGTAARPALKAARCGYV